MMFYRFKCWLLAPWHEHRWERILGDHHASINADIEAAKRRQQPVTAVTHRGW